jgi:hypothetical protein
MCLRLLYRCISDVRGGVGDCRCRWQVIFVGGADLGSTIYGMVPCMLECIFYMILFRLILNGSPGSCLVSRKRSEIGGLSDVIAPQLHYLKLRQI